MRYAECMLSLVTGMARQGVEKAFRKRGLPPPPLEASAHIFLRGRYHCNQSEQLKSVRLSLIRTNFI